MWHSTQGTLGLLLGLNMIKKMHCLNSGGGRCATPRSYSVSSNPLTTGQGQSLGMVQTL